LFPEASKRPGGNPQNKTRREGFFVQVAELAARRNYLKSRGHFIPLRTGRVSPEKKTRIFKSYLVSKSEKKGVGPIKSERVTV